MSSGRRIILMEEDEWWVVTDDETGVTTQGETREIALDNLDEAVALYNGKTGHTPTDGELQEMGIDPDNNVSGHELPDVLQ